MYVELGIFCLLCAIKDESQNLRNGKRCKVHTIPSELEIKFYIVSGFELGDCNAQVITIFYVESMRNDRRKCN